MAPLFLERLVEREEIDLVFDWFLRRPNLFLWTYAGSEACGYMVAVCDNTVPMTVQQRCSWALNGTTISGLNFVEVLKQAREEFGDGPGLLENSRDSTIMVQGSPRPVSRN